jgi:hypothetical protein
MVVARTHALLQRFKQQNSYWQGTMTFRLNSLSYDGTSAAFFGPVDRTGTSRELSAALTVYIARCCCGEIRRFGRA